MLTNLKQKNLKVEILYNAVLLLSRNEIFYTKFDLRDTFQNRINLIFIHISFLFIKVKNNINKEIYKKFYQKLFDLTFNKIEQNMREIGYGDVLVNKNMKFLVKNFYNILLYCENYNKNEESSKKRFFFKYLDVIKNQNRTNYIDLIDYFNKYEVFCIALNPDIVLKGNIKFNYK